MFGQARTLDPLVDCVARGRAFSRGEPYARDFSGSFRHTDAPVLYSAPVTYTNHPPGMPHVRSTIGKMSALAKKGASSYPIVNLARRIVAAAGVPSKDYRGELAALYKWVRANIAYRKDPVHLEWLQSPDRTVEERAGDCDDHAILLAALAGALGHRYHFDTVGPSRNVQKHVATVVDLGDGPPVVLDPVLEPASSSTTPRADLGTFGLRAHGAHILWSSEGRMLGFMGSVVNRRDARLWDWNPYYPPLGPGLQTGMQSAQGGVPGTPTYPYRLRNAPGWDYARRHPGGNTLNGPMLVRYPNGELGFSFIKMIKGVGKAVGKVVHVAGKLARSPIVQAGANALLPGSGAAIAQAGQIEASAESMIAKRGKGSSWKLPHPALAKLYPKGAKQVFDGKHQVFRVYVPSSSGLHGIRPSLSFSLGAVSGSTAHAAIDAVNAYRKQHGSSPTVAVAAVRTMQRDDADGRVGALKIDGLWGPNSRRAASFYTGIGESQLPPVATAFAKTKITWQPPAVRAAPPAPGPAPAPVATAAPKPAAAPKAAPGVPPAPIPGYIEVGHEANNPGLGPITPSTPGATAAAAASSAPAAAAPTPVKVVPVAAAPKPAPKKKAPAPVKVVPVAAAPKKKAPKKKPAPAAVVVTPVDVTGRGGPAVPMPPAILTVGPAIPGGMTTEEYARAAAPGAGERASDEKLMWAAIAYLWYRQRKGRQAA